MVTRAQRRANRVFAGALDRWLGRLEESEEVSRTVHNRLAARVARDLRGSSSRQVNAAIGAAFSRFEGDRMALIEEAVRVGSRNGSGLTPSVARALFGDARARRAIAPSLGNVAEDVAARRLAARQHRAAVNAEDLRTRLRRRTRVLTERMSNDVIESVQLGETTKALSERVLRAQDIEVRIPRYIQRVRDAARTAAPSEMRSMVRRQLNRIGALNTRGQPQDIRRETKRFLRRIERTSGADIDAAVETWVRGRAHNQAMTIARTEGQGAFNEAYVQSTTEQDWVVGYRWNLSPSHRKADICDVMANQDNYGLGPGGYPKGEVPALAHPNDLCFFTAITDEHFFERERARLRGEPEPPKPWETDGETDARSWLQQQSPERRREILGPGRAREFESRPTKVVNGDGSFQPLYTIQGRPSPALPAGERFVHRANGDVGRLITGPTPSPARQRRAAELEAARLQRQRDAERRAEEAARRRAEAARKPQPQPRPQPRPQPAPATSQLRPSPARNAPEPRPIGVMSPNQQARHAREVSGVDTDRDGIRDWATRTRSNLESIGEVSSSAAGRAAKPTAASRALRRDVRGLLQAQYPDMVSSDAIRRSGRNAMVVDTTLERQGAFGRHGWDGNITLASRARRMAARGARDIANGAAPTPEAYGSLRTVIHEELHGYSPAKSGAYRGVGRGLEEATVEIRARQSLARVMDSSRLPVNSARVPGVSESAGPGSPLRFSSQRGGSYGPYVQQFYGATARATGLLGRELEDFVDEGLTRHFGTTRQVNSPNGLVNHVAREMANGDERLQRRLARELRASELAVPRPNTDSAARPIPESVRNPRDQ